MDAEDALAHHDRRNTLRAPVHHLINFSLEGSDKYAVKRYPLPVLLRLIQDLRPALTENLVGGPSAHAANCQGRTLTLFQI